MSKTRWTLAGIAATGTLGAATLLWYPAASNTAEVTVYKSASCGCCNDWIAHLREHGFRVEARNVEETLAIKRQHGVTPELTSCHTAVVGGYVVEGHVPAQDIRRLLAERPAVKGIAAPGMPLGSPGMEQGGYRQPFDVLSFDAQGRTAVFSSYR